MVQAVTGSPPQVIDLTIRQPCAPHEQSSEVTVCGRRPGDASPYRIDQPLARGSDLPKAELQIVDGVRVSAETEASSVGGFQSNRAMIRLKVKF